MEDLPAPSGPARGLKDLIGGVRESFWARFHGHHGEIKGTDSGNHLLFGDGFILDVRQKRLIIQSLNYNQGA
jgi:hypothetical protein